MTDQALCDLIISQAAELLSAGKLSPVELVVAHLDRIERTEPLLNSFITLLAEDALEQARAAERDIRSGNYISPLHGIPFGAKDIFDTAGVRTAAGSKVWADRVPDRDSAPVAIVQNAGAVLMGKVHTTEFAAGDPAPSKNPWNVEHTAGVDRVSAQWSRGDAPAGPGVFQRSVGLQRGQADHRVEAQLAKCATRLAVQASEERRQAIEISLAVRLERVMMTPGTLQPDAQEDLRGRLGQIGRV